MAIRNIVTEGDPILRKKSRPVTDFGSKTAQLLEDMRETLQQAQGLGLAGPQVGILRRICLVTDNDGTVLELLNPEITERSKEQEGAYEGCLSVPDMRGWVERPVRVTVKAQDRTGREVVYHLTDMASRCACHEMDHLDGRLYVDLTDELLTEEELESRLEEEEE